MRILSDQHHGASGLHIKYTMQNRAWHCSCSTHAIVTLSIPACMPSASATGKAIPHTLYYTTRHPVTDIDSSAATPPVYFKKASKRSSWETTSQRDFPILNYRYLKSWTSRSKLASSLLLNAQVARARVCVCKTHFKDFTGEPGCCRQTNGQTARYNLSQIRVPYCSRSAIRRSLQLYE